ncbi:MAG TPA: imidazole glycerol phosphate synthase subunit HisH [Gemmatimonadaceae bacterium]|nr:imidazole glycerol phosphate synthase subunit HisH [Gemmatimonadaceae bacterium]
MISVVSYGVGNVGSIFSMLRKIGVPAIAASTPDDIAKAERIILPGVGAFDHGMAMLAEHSLIEPLRERAGAGIPLLGICLGMQLLGRASEEGIVAGLGVMDAHSVRFLPGGERPLKIPHMGWSELTIRRQSPLLDGFEDQARFYFVHSYHYVCDRSEDVLATAPYGIDFTAVVQRDNVWGAQFHPEKSHRFGMTLLRNFARL